jgi:hypothetical protein
MVICVPQRPKDSKFGNRQTNAPDEMPVFAIQIFRLEIRARVITIVLAVFILENETIISASWASRVRDFQVQISELKHSVSGRVLLRSVKS